MQFEVDSSELRKLDVDLGKVPAEMLKDVRAVVQKGSLNIKKDAAQKVSGFSHLPHYPKSISYDTRNLAHTIIGEIGPDKGRTQGPLGNLIEFGSVNNAPIPHMAPALETEEPKYLKALENLMGTILDGD